MSSDTPNKNDGLLEFAEKEGTFRSGFYSEAENNKITKMIANEKKQKLFRKSPSPEKLEKLNKLEVLFATAQKLYASSDQLKASLEKAGGDPKKLPQDFEALLKQHAKNISEYNDQYINAANLSEKDPDIGKFMKKLNDYTMSVRPASGNAAALTFNQVTMMPVQRGPRFNLHFKEIIDIESTPKKKELRESGLSDDQVKAKLDEFCSQDPLISKLKSMDTMVTAVLKGEDKPKSDATATTTPAATIPAATTPKARESAQGPSTPDVAAPDATAPDATAPTATTPTATAPVATTPTATAPAATTPAATTPTPAATTPAATTPTPAATTPAAITPTAPTISAPSATARATSAPAASVPKPEAPTPKRWSLIGAIRDFIKQIMTSNEPKQKAPKANSAQITPKSSGDITSGMTGASSVDANLTSKLAALVSSPDASGPSISASATPDTKPVVTSGFISMKEQNKEQIGNLKQVASKTPPPTPPKPAGLIPSEIKTPPPVPPRADKSKKI